MICFPDLQTLQLALVTGVVPEKVADAPAKANFAADGQVRVRPSKPLSKAVRDGLAQLGARSVRGGAEPDVEVRCWPQLLPLARSGTIDPPEASTAVIFDLPAWRMPEMVAEVLRLGNDRQGLRWLTRNDEPEALAEPKPGDRAAKEISQVEGAGADRVLLRVVGPPFYALLGALEEDRAGGADGIRAYVERGPRLLVELGYRHAFVDRLRVPDGRLALLSAPRRWTLVDESRFHDVYEVLDFALPKSGRAFRDIHPRQRLTVPMRLARSGTSESPQLWVLQGTRAIEQLDALVQHSDDRLIGRLAFAVAQPEADGQEGEDPNREEGLRVILRVRPSREAPPALALDGLAMRPYLRLPNLFLPVGHRLHPPLRRDAVARLLASQGEMITWLVPEPSVGTPPRLQRFVPESLPDLAFHPLNQWVDYILDRDAPALQSWMDSHQFAFTSFMTREDAEETPGTGRSRASKRSRDEDRDEVIPPVPDAVGESPDESAPLPLDPDPTEPVAAQPTCAAQRRLSELEAEFLASDLPADDPMRLPMWQSMARLNTHLGRHGDASLCWAHALWEADEPTIDELTRWREDARAGADPTLEDPSGWDSLLEGLDPPVSHLRVMVSELVLAAESVSQSATGPPTVAEPIGSRLGRIQQTLQASEPRLSMRVVWMAWSALARLCGGDALMLARARDRILERLHGEGLSVELNLPSFLRFGIEASGERQRNVRDHLGWLRERSLAWVHDYQNREGQRSRGASQRAGSDPVAIVPYTPELVELTFAYGLARLGESATAQTRLAEARGGLREKRGQVETGVTSWIGEAYAMRIQQCDGGGQAHGPLSEALLERLQSLPSGHHHRYAIDRLRKHSQILDPNEQLDTYRNYNAITRDPLGQELVTLVDLLDRDELRSRLASLLGRADADSTPALDQARILEAVLGRCFLMGDRFARPVLERVPPIYQNLSSAIRDSGRVVELQVALLERALTVAAHFDHQDLVQAWVDLFEDVVDRSRDVTAVEKLDALLEQGFHGLRKLGMQDQITRMLEAVGRLCEDLQRGGDRDRTVSGISPFRIQQLRLHQASGWLSGGQVHRAQPILDEAFTEIDAILHPPPTGARSILYLDAIQLGRSLIRTLRNAPVDLAIAEIEKVFTAFEEIKERRTFNLYYSLMHLDLVEAIVLTLVSDEFRLDQAGRRWLDEDEYLVRRRIHQDVREALGGELSHA